MSDRCFSKTLADSAETVELVGTSSRTVEWGMPSVQRLSSCFFFPPGYGDGGFSTARVPVNVGGWRRMAVSTRCLVSQWASGSSEGNGWWPVEQKTDLFESLTNSVSLFFARTATTSIQELNEVRIFS